MTSSPVSLVYPIGLASLNIRWMNTPPNIVPAESDIRYSTRLSTFSLLMNRKNAPIAESTDVKSNAVAMLVRLLMSKQTCY